jgi:hypothetical protein
MCSNLYSIPPCSKPFISLKCIGDDRSIFAFRFDHRHSFSTIHLNDTWQWIPLQCKSTPLHACDQLCFKGGRAGWQELARWKYNVPSIIAKNYTSTSHFGIGMEGAVDVQLDPSRRWRRPYFSQTRLSPYCPMWNWLLKWFFSFDAIRLGIVLDGKDGFTVATPTQEATRR